MKKSIFCLAILPLSATIELVHEVPDQTTQHYFLSMKGAYEHVSGAPHRAAKTYGLLKKLAPQSSPLHHAAIRLSFERADYQAVIDQAHRITVNNPEHKQPAMLLAQAYLFVNRPHDALDILDTLTALYPHDSSLGYYTALSLIKAQEFDKAHRLVNATLKQDAGESRHFLFHFLNAKLAFLENNFEQARIHIERSLAQHPRFAKGIVLKAVIAEKQNRITDALATYESYLGLTRDPEITGKVISLCFLTGNYQRALELLASQPRDTADYHHDMALILYKLGKKKEALNSIEKSLEKDGQYAKAHTLFAHLMIAEKRFDELGNRFCYWLIARPNDNALIASWYQLTTKNLPLIHATQTLKKAAKKTGSFLLQFALADLLHQHQQYDQARTWYKKALKAVPDELAKSKLWFQIACTHHAQQKSGAAYDAIQKALACAVVYPSAHNLAALLLMNSDHTRAQEYIEAALLAAPDNKSYLETQSQITVTV